MVKKDMCTSGFIKGALFGMIVSGAVCMMMPRKKTLCRRSVLGKSIKLAGDVVEGLMTVLR